MESYPSFEEFQFTPPRTDIDLEKAAKKQVAPSPIPEGYLSQLRAHLKEFPEDFLFQLTPRSGDGFGIIRCLEPGCSSDPIVLKPRTKRADGGRSVGVGGLAAFQQHILDHDDHERLRDRRVSTRAAPKSLFAQATVQPASSVRDTDKENDTNPSYLSLNDDPKSFHPTSSSRSQSTSSKRTPSSPPTSSRSVKRPNLTLGRSNPTSKATRQTPVINLVSSDDNVGDSIHPRTNNSSPSKGQPLVVDVDTSDADSDLKLVNVKSFGKQDAPIEVDETKPNTFGSKKHRYDVDELRVSSDDDIDLAWMKKQGIVPPKNQSRKPKASTSRLSASILDNATPRPGRSGVAPSSSLVDRKPGLPHTHLNNKPHRSRLESLVRNSPYDRMLRHLAGDVAGSASLTAQPRVKAGSPFTDPFHPLPSVHQPSSPSTSAFTNFKREPTGQLFGHYGGPASSSPFPADQKPGQMSHVKAGSPFIYPPNPLGFVHQASSPSTSALSNFKREPTAELFGNYGGPASSSPFSIGRTPGGMQNPWDLSDGSSSDEDESRLHLLTSASQPIFPHLYGNSAIRPGIGMPVTQPQVRSDETHEFLKQAVQNMSFTHNATVAGAREELGFAEGQEPRLDGLSVLLMPHQVIGVAWMIKQEKSKNMGGILGDEMGLGKTIQMIATIVKNCSTDSKTRSTLVLAPLALLTQWKEEITERSTCDLSILIYHSSNKVNERKKISNYDVVITTLDTLRGDWHDDDAEVESTKKSRGLYKVDWYRVVIDEAQIIRNRNSKKSRAVCALKSIYRWCLTGTPIFNTLWDLYPYLRFLRIRPYNDHHRFREHIITWEKRRPGVATQRAQAVLATCMLRRQKNTKLDGKPLILLPPKHEEDVMLQMSPDEREIYDMLEKRAQQKFNVFLRRGTVLKNFACILVLLLRLRQACGHPSLAIEEGDGPSNLQDSSEPQYADPESELKRAIDERGQDWVDNIKKKFLAEAQELVQAEQQDRNEATAPECPICNDALDDTSRVTKCGHVFCETCLETLIMQRVPMEDHSNTDPNRITKPCPNCRTPFCRIDTYLKKAFLPPSDDLDDDEDLAGSEIVKVRRKMRSGVLDDSDEDQPSAKGKEKEKPFRSEFVPSTKLAWLMSQIEMVKKESPTDKIIVVSQWTGMLAICGTFLRERGLRYVSYQGDMSTVERNQAVQNFKKKPEYSIMLMSLKCGGVGLNLTCANRVISLDLAWSPASEKQAFDRAHRFGQEKTVYVKRVMLTDTVEERICRLQKGKQDITDCTLGEGTGKKLKPMTVSELASLFNLNRHGETLN